MPSFASLFTGLLPYRHGSTGGGSRLEPDATTLAETLRSRGYATHAFVAVDYLTSAFSMDRGFEQHRSFLEGRVSTRSDVYRDELLQFIRGEHERPFLLFAHFYDAHSPYKPPPPFSGMYYQGNPYAAENAGLGLPPDASPDIYGWLAGVTDIEFPVAQYAAGISHVDHAVGLLLDELRESGLMDRSIVVVTGDHGEHLTEHGLRFYHQHPYEEVLHVPLMIRLPGAIGGGGRIRDEVSLIDVYPTLLSLLGLPVDRSLDGIDLVGRMRGEAPQSDRYLYSEFGSTEERWMKAVWDDRYRLVSFNIDGKQRMELYHRKLDRSERFDLAGLLPWVRNRLAGELDARFPPGRRIRPHPSQPAEPVDPEVRSRLRALGYEE